MNAQQRRNSQALSMAYREADIAANEACDKAATERANGGDGYNGLGCREYTAIAEQHGNHAEQDARLSALISRAAHDCQKGDFAEYSAREILELATELEALRKSAR